MTLIDDRTTTRTATATGPVPTVSIDHPAFGAARRADVSPVTLTLYRVTLDGAVLGYLRADGADWLALAGSDETTAVVIDRRTTLPAALALLTSRH